MKVYRIKSDINRYQVLSPVHSPDLQKLRTDGTVFGPAWQPPKVYFADNKALASDFLSQVGSSIVTSPRATEALRGILEAAGELLPLPCDGTEYTLTNVLNVLDCLDAGRSVTYPYVKTYVFDATILRTSVSSVFKIPQSRQMWVYAVEGLLSPELDFMTVFKQHGFRGLSSQLVWSDEE